MSRSNANIAELLRRYAATLSLQGADRFRLNAYRRAAETIEGLQDDVARLVEQGSDLTRLPGIGKGIKEVITEIVRSGKLARLERTLAEMKPELAELSTRPALDPKKVTRIYKKLGIGSLEELKKGLDEGRIGSLLGSRMEYHVRQGLDDRPRSLLYSVQDIAAKIERYLASLPGVTRASMAGSLRRKQDTIGDLNFLVAGKNPGPIFERFALGGVLSSAARGDSERVFKLSSGLTLTLRWTPPEEWGLSLMLATGSAAHVADLKARAAARKVPLTRESLAAKHIDLSDELSVYSALGLAFIEPELREGRGEVAAAARRKLPQLVKMGDIRGDLHMHTTASDGVNTIAEMAAAARERGYEYIAITDHSQSLKVTNGLSEARLLEQIRNIDNVNAKLQSGFRVLKSAEVDILEDGRLDYSDSVLKELDFTICSIHSRFVLNKEQQTQRILRAMDNRSFTILGHATGRLLLKRQGYDLDIERVMEHAKATGCMFEINSSPDRLDLSDEHAKLAKEKGIKVAVNTDAHSVYELDFMSAGINQARRGWLEAADVLNARPLDDLLLLFRR